MNKFCCTLFALMACSNILFGQIQRAEDFMIPMGVSELDLSKIIGGIDQKLNEYRRFGKLLNPKTKIIDRESINLFKTLFEQDAKVYNDMQDLPDEVLYDLEGYANIARRYFNLEGVIFGITEPELKYLAVYDGEMVCSVFLSKAMDKFYNAEGEIKQESRAIPLEFVFSIPKNNLSAPKIRTIRSAAALIVADDYTSYIGIDLHGGMQQIGYVFNKYGAQGNVSANASLAYQAGLVWYSNFFGRAKSRRKNLFATVGLNLQYSQVKGQLSIDSLPAEAPFELNLSNGIPFDKLVFRTEKVEATEKRTLIQLQMPVGVSYRLLHRNTIALMLDVAYVPALSISGNSEIENGSYGIYNLVGIKGKINYDYNKAEPGTNNLSSIYDLLIKDRSLGRQKIEYAWKPKMNLTHQVGVALTFFKDFIDDSPSFGIAFGINAVVGLSNVLENETLDKGALFSGIKDGRDTQYANTGILGTYIQDVTIRNFGLRLIVYRKATRKP